MTKRKYKGYQARLNDLCEAAGLKPVLTCQQVNRKPTSRRIEQAISPAEMAVSENYFWREKRGMEPPNFDFRNQLKFRTA